MVLKDFWSVFFLELHLATTTSLKNQFVYFTIQINPNLYSQVEQYERYKLFHIYCLHLCCWRKDFQQVKDALQKMVTLADLQMMQNQFLICHQFYYSWSHLFKFLTEKYIYDRLLWILQLWLLTAFNRYSRYRIGRWLYKVLGVIGYHW